MVLGEQVAERDGTDFQDVTPSWQSEQEETMCQDYRWHHLDGTVANRYLVNVKVTVLACPSVMYRCP